MDSEFRPLNARETELLEKLLELDFQGRDELRSQMISINSVTSSWICFAAVLHVDKNGFIRMLEIIKYGQTAIINPPTARDLVLIDIRVI